MADDMTVELVGHTLVLTLNRPAKLNAITHSMVQIWVDALGRARVDRAVYNVVVTGAGRAFCSGADLAMMPTGSDVSSARTRGAQDDELEHFAYRVPVALDDLDKPVITAVNGVAVGAGLGMALTSDLRFFSDQARVAESYINVGIFPGDCDTFFLPRVVGPSQALLMMWSGEMLDAAECLRVGLADRVIANDDLMAHTMDFAAQLSEKSQIALRTIKRATLSSRNMNLRDSLGLISGCREIVNTSPERIAAFEKFMASRKKP